MPSLTCELLVEIRDTLKKLEITTNNTIMDTLHRMEAIMVNNNINKLSINAILDILNKPYNGYDCSQRIDELYKNNQILIDEKLSVELHIKAITNKHYNVVDTLYRLQYVKLSTKTNLITYVENTIIELDNADIFEYLTDKFNINEYGKYHDKISDCDAINIFKLLEKLIGYDDILNKCGLIKRALDKKSIKILRHVFTNIDEYNKYICAKSLMQINGYVSAKNLEYQIKAHFIINDIDMVTDDIITSDIICDHFLCLLNGNSKTPLLTQDQLTQITSKAKCLRYNSMRKSFF